MSLSLNYHSVTRTMNFFACTRLTPHQVQLVHARSALQVPVHVLQMQAPTTCAMIKFFLLTIMIKTENISLLFVNNFIKNAISYITIR